MPESVGMELDHDDKRHRFTLTEDGRQLALIDYTLDGKVATFTHTETDPAAQGRGLAGQLTTFALDYADEQRWKVVPQCPYTRDFIDKHPEYAGLLA